MKKLILLTFAFAVLGLAFAQEAFAGYTCKNTSGSTYCSADTNCTNDGRFGYTLKTNCGSTGTSPCTCYSFSSQPPTYSGGSTVLVYTCSVGQGTNTITPGATPADPDIFVSEGAVSCIFTGEVQGTASCSYNVTWSGDLVKCDDTSGDAVVTLQAKCNDNFNVAGSLHCPAQVTFPEVTDYLGISSSSECRRLLGRNTKLLDTTVTFGGQTCDQVLTLTNNEDFALAGLTNTVMNLCHSDGALEPDCITPGGGTNTASSDQRNLGEAQCVAFPQTWNIDCGGNKDQGNGSVCYVNGATGFYSFDPTELNAQTATVNGVPVTRCRIADCDGDGLNDDFRCTVDTCVGGSATAAGGLLTMITNFKGDTSGLTCTTTVATSGG